MRYNGTVISKGIVIGPVFCMSHEVKQISKTTNVDPEHEWQRLEQAIASVKQDVLQIQENAKKRELEDHLVIFDALLLMLEDPQWLGQVRALLQEEQVTAAYAYQHVGTKYITMLESSNNMYFMERMDDINDMMNRVLRQLVMQGSDVNVPENAILVAQSIGPADTMEYIHKGVQGIILASGGSTSHSAILARSLEVPMIVCDTTDIEQLSSGQSIILDGNDGVVVIQPSKAELDQYINRQKADIKRQLQYSAFETRSTITKDNHPIELLVNANQLKDVERAISFNTDGIGLYRTEYVYFGNTSLPSEEEQYNIYKDILLKANGTPVVFRTLDCGDDKPVPDYFRSSDTSDVRGIQLTLAHPEIFKTQMRALMKASTHGTMKVMFPMISTKAEWLEAKALWNECKTEVDNVEKTSIDKIPVGIMVEVPQIMEEMDYFLEEVDFCSIGTNDLTQLAFGLHRDTNRDAVRKSFHPTILKWIKQLVQKSKKYNKPLHVCGEIGSTIDGALLLIGIGIDSLSIRSDMIVKIRYFIDKYSYDNLVEIATICLKMEDEEEVIAYIKSALEKVELL